MNDENYKKKLEHFDSLEKKVLVLCGMPKTGTTLPLALLDGHSRMTVYPEELRFFHLRCDSLPAKEAAITFLENLNTRMLASKNVYFDPENYMSHGGTGFGRRDYSAFDFDYFADHVGRYVNAARCSRQRFLGILLAFCEAKGTQPCDGMVFACKAPRNELYADEWNSILGSEGRYVLITRRPTEHYVSLSKIALFQQNKGLSVGSFVRDVRKAYDCWDRLPIGATLLLDYDKLINDSKYSINRILELMGLSFEEEKNSVPTKMGVPWSGNSSKGKIEHKVFENPHTAEKILKQDIYGFIEHGLKDLYSTIGWNVRGRSRRIERIKIHSLDFIHRAKRKIASAIRN